MTNEKFLKLLEGKFNIHEHSDCVELETWTDGGVNMFITLHKNEKSYYSQFKESVQYFDIDEEIDVHRQDQNYKNDFTIRESVHDFESYTEWLQEILESLE